MLSLAARKEPKYEAKLLTNRARTLILAPLLQDPIPMVRKGVLMKLWSCLRTQRLPSQNLSYFAMIPLAATVGDAELSRQAAGYFDWLVRARRQGLLRMAGGSVTQRLQLAPVRRMLARFAFKKLTALINIAGRNRFYRI